jgi:hypothetical protein
MKKFAVIVPIEKGFNKSFIINSQVKNHIYLTENQRDVRENMKRLNIKIDKPKHGMDLPANLNKYGSIAILTLSYFVKTEVNVMQVLVSDQASVMDVEGITHPSLGFIRKWIKDAIDLANVKTKTDLVTINKLSA